MVRGEDGESRAGEKRERERSVWRRQAGRRIGAVSCQRWRGRERRERGDPRLGPPGELCSREPGQRGMAVRACLKQEPGSSARVHAQNVPDPCPSDRLLRPTTHMDNTLTLSLTHTQTNTHADAHILAHTHTHMI